MILERERGRLRLRLAAERLGDDLCASLTGGERPHVGAVAVSQARPSHSGGGRRSASTSVITLLGHEEDELARAVAARLASALGGTVSLTCGIHLDGILPEELEGVQQLAGELVTALLAALETP